MLLSVCDANAARQPRRTSALCLDHMALSVTERGSTIHLGRAYRTSLLSCIVLGALMLHSCPSRSIRLWLCVLAGRRKPLLFGITLALAGFSAASARAQVQGILFQGTARPVVAHGTGSWCAAELGPTSFERVRAGLALMSFPALHYTLSTSSGATYYTLSGQARLVFSNATAGTLRFTEPKAYPPDVLSPTFTAYSESYDAGRLIVRFRIRFANCNFLFVGTHRS